jgi:nucleotide-binding universal stress UspA family protein
MDDTGRTAETPSPATAARFELGTDGPRAIVVGVDGSAPSLRAAAYAAGVARREGSRLVAVYARNPSLVAAVGDRTGAAITATYEAQDTIEAALRKTIAEHVRDWGVDTTFVARVGDPMRVLTDVADEVRADAVIVGASASFGHKIAGSLAVRLVRSKRWPVAVVP